MGSLGPMVQCIIGPTAWQVCALWVAMVLSTWTWFGQPHPSSSNECSRNWWGGWRFWRYRLRRWNQDKDKECNEEQIKEEEEEEEEGGDASAFDTDTSLLGGNFAGWFKPCLILHAFILIYIAVEEVMESDRFDQDAFSLSGPVIRVCPFLAIWVVDPKFRPFFTNQDLELKYKRIKT